MVEKNGKRLPEKDDQFTITTQVQNRDGWMLHPLDAELRKTTTGKLRAIPVRFLFNDPDLNLRAEYSCFDHKSGATGVPLAMAKLAAVPGMPALRNCRARRRTACAFGQGGACKPYGALNALIGDEDEMGSFIFRTTSYNSIRTLAARLHYFAAVSGNLLACLPLELKLRGKSTTQSYRSAIYYVDLGVRAGSTLEAAITQARELDARRRAAGFDQAALDAAARAGFSNGAFEDSIEESAAVAEEFYPSESGGGKSQGDGIAEPEVPPASGLRGKLEQRAALLGGKAA